MFEREYALLGDWKGPSSDNISRRSIRAFWVSSGRSGALWLAARARDEEHPDVQYDIAHFLGSIGFESIEPIARELSSAPNDDQVRTLLLALKRIAPPGDMQLQNGLAALLERFLRHPDFGISEAAAYATRALSLDVAAGLLRSALVEIQMDSDTERVIRDELELRLSRRS
ncbi:MAG: hypothetical protein HYV63_07590 [Candidatus Schekmanbacteria bacterium]|nr:hypothetical protein [Candidatus Schekmanbacteria bacterium]